MIAFRWILFIYIGNICKTGVSSNLIINITKEFERNLGSNSTYIECTYANTSLVKFVNVEIEALINRSFIPIITYDPDFARTEVQVDYLKGRVSYNTITQSSRKVTLHFTELLCIDDRDYQCAVTFKLENLKTQTVRSETTHINVQVDPSVPDTLLYLKTTDSSIKKDKNHATNCSSNDRLLQEGDIVVVHCNGNVGRPAGDLIVQLIHKNSTVYNLTRERTEFSFTDNCSFYNNSSFTLNLTADNNDGYLRCAEKRLIYFEETSVASVPLNVKYQVRTPVIEENSKEHSRPPITLTCNSTGNPLPEYAWYRMTSTGQLGIWEMYVNNTQTITLTNVTENGVYRCDVSNTVGCVSHRKNTTWIVKFEVQPLRITKLPYQTKYTEGTSIKLTCSSFDYPNGIYRWILPDGTVISGSLYIISNAKRNQSGVYTCLLSFTFTSEPTIRVVTEKIIIGNPENSSSQCTTSSNGTAIIGSVSGTLLLCLVIFGVFHLWRRSKLQMSEPGRQMTIIKTNDDSNNYEGMGENRTVHHYDDLRIRQEQQYYNTPVKTRR